MFNDFVPDKKENLYTAMLFISDYSDCRFKVGHFKYEGIIPMIEDFNLLGECNFIYENKILTISYYNAHLRTFCKFYEIDLDLMTKLNDDYKVKYNVHLIEHF